MPVAQVICLSHATVLVCLLGGEGIRFRSEHKKATKKARKASSCIFLCCLTELHREVDWFTVKFWNQTESASTISISAAAVQCLPHSPPKITKGLIKPMQFMATSSLQVRASPHLPSTAPHITDVRGKNFCILGRRKFQNQ